MIKGTAEKQERKREREIMIHRERERETKPQLRCVWSWSLSRWRWLWRTWSQEKNMYDIVQYSPYVFYKLHHLSALWCTCSMCWRKHNSFCVISQAHEGCIFHGLLRALIPPWRMIMIRAKKCRHIFLTPSHAQVALREKLELNQWLISCKVTDLTFGPLLIAHIIVIVNSLDVRFQGVETPLADVEDSLETLGCDMNLNMCL